MFSDPVSALGAGATAYSVAAGTAMLLQARTMWRRGSSRDVSIAFLGSTCVGYLIWLLYGIGIGSFALIFADAIGLVCGLVSVSAALWLRRGAGGHDDGVGELPASALSEHGLGRFVRLVDLLSDEVEA
jgi:uncharacterized protein with PQ loop repeat